MLIVLSSLCVVSWKQFTGTSLLHSAFWILAIGHSPLASCLAKCIDRLQIALCSQFAAQIDLNESGGNADCAAKWPDAIFRLLLAHLWLISAAAASSVTFDTFANGLGRIGRNSSFGCMEIEYGQLTSTAAKGNSLDQFVDGSFEILPYIDYQIQGKTIFPTGFIKNGSLNFYSTIVY